MSAASPAGSIFGAYLSTTDPSRPIRNLVKFHFTAPPSRPSFCSFSQT